MNFIKQNKHILLISDNFVPQKISVAGMIYNLSQEIINKKIGINCDFSDYNESIIEKEYDLKGINLIQTNFLKSFRNKSLIFRFIFEVSTSIILATK